MGNGIIIELMSSQDALEYTALDKWATQLGQLHTTLVQRISNI